MRRVRWKRAMPSGSLSGPTFRRYSIHFMLRAAALHSVLRTIPGFPGLTARTGSTSRHPEALGACYVASWQLPRPTLID